MHRNIVYYKTLVFVKLDRLMVTFAYNISIFGMNTYWPRIAIFCTAVSNPILPGSVGATITEGTGSTWLSLKENDLVTVWTLLSYYWLYCDLDYSIMLLLSSYRSWGWAGPRACCFGAPIFYPFIAPFWPVLPCLTWIFRTWHISNVP